MIAIQYELILVTRNVKDSVKPIFGCSIRGALTRTTYSVFAILARQQRRAVEGHPCIDLLLRWTWADSEMAIGVRASAGVNRGEELNARFILEEFGTERAAYRL